MPWYGAHAVMYFQLTDGPQDEYLVQENVFLVRAASPAEAMEKAAEIARGEEGDSRGSLTLDDRPAYKVFGTVRKVVEVSHVGSDDQPGHGDEITYSEFALKDRAALDRLLAAESVDVHYLGKDR